MLVDWAHWHDAAEVVKACHGLRMARPYTRIKADTGNNAAGKSPCSEADGLTQGGGMGFHAEGHSYRGSS